MRILISCLMGVCITITACLIWQKYELFTFKNIKKDKNLFLLIGTLLLAAGIEVFLAYEEYHWIIWLKANVLFVILLICSYVDLKKQIIPNKILLVSLPVKVVISIMEFFILPETFIPMLFSSVIGAVLGIGLLFIVSLMSKGGLGMGDVKLFGAIGFIIGFYGMYNTLFYGAIIITLFAAVGMILKKINRKSQIPFGPFVFAGYLAVVLMGAF